LSTDAHLRRIVAGNPAAPAHLLEILAADQDEQVRENVAGNPNTPWQTLEQLAWEFPYAFLHNPVGPLQMVAHPEQISTNGWFWDALLRSATIPSLWWDWLLSHSILSTSQSMRLHVQYAGEASSFSGTSQETDEQVLLTLAVLLTTASARKMPPPTLPSTVSARQAMTTDEQAVEKLLRRLARSSKKDIRRAIASNQQTPVLVLRTLARDKNGWVRAAVAEHSQTPVDVLRMLAQDDYEDKREVKIYGCGAIVRRGVASNQQTPVEVLQTLARDKDAGVREAVASNWQTPLSILHILRRDQAWHVRIAVAGNPHTSLPILQIMAQDPLPGVRATVAEHERIPVEMVQTLAQDPFPIVREAVAKQKQTPEEVLQFLAHDDEWTVRTAVAQNKQTSAETLQFLAQDEQQWLSVPSHQQMLPEDPLLGRVTNEYKQVKLAVASHPQVLGTVLHLLSQDEDSQVRAAVARHPQAPMEVLCSLAWDRDEWIRRAVAEHPRTLASLSRKLAPGRAKDEKWLVNSVKKQLAENGTSWESEWWQEPCRKMANIRGARLEIQLDTLAKLETSDVVREAIAVALATDWDTTRVRTAFETDEKKWEVRNTLCINGMRAERILAPFFPSIALQKLAMSSSWEVRYLVALHTRTPWETRQRLSKDGNRYVRAIARAKLELLSE
jgi:hypothetical protein